MRGCFHVCVVWCESPDEAGAHWDYNGLCRSFCAIINCIDFPSGACDDPNGNTLSLPLSRSVSSPAAWMGGEDTLGYSSTLTLFWFVLYNDMCVWASVPGPAGFTE